MILARYVCKSEEHMKNLMDNLPDEVIVGSYEHWSGGATIHPNGNTKAFFIQTIDGKICVILAVNSNDRALKERMWNEYYSQSLALYR